MEKLFKKYPGLITPLQYVITLLLFVQCSIIIGISVFPSAYLIETYWSETSGTNSIFRLLGLSILSALGYFIYSIVVIFVVAFVCWVLRLKIKEGKYYAYSLDAIRWANYNSLILIVRYTCINFLRVTPFIVLFHRMMGAKIGKNVQINTAIIGDSCLLEIGDNSVIGGDVTLVAHVAEHHHLVVKRVKIGKNVTVGLMSIIMPGVEIGDRVMIAANSVLIKDTKVPANTVWAGIPAKQISVRN